MNKNIYDDLDVGEVPKKSSGLHGNLPFKFIAIGIGVLVVVGVIIIVILLSGAGNSRVQAAKNMPVTESTDDALVVKAFATQFLTKYYWYNRDSWQQVRQELEKMMTTNFLEKYKRVYYDPDFEKTVQDSYCIVSPTFDAVLYKQDATGTYAGVLGDIQYLNGRTGASRKCVSTWTLKVVNSDGRYLVDDFVIDMGAK